ncbi:G-protein alpha subunit [Mycena sanguinolenta]|nr:G-protein alpha subunit [Mycena sanguinolenta]
MGTTTSSQASQARSEEIDRQLEEESLRFKKEIPILVLGTDETSKSTVATVVKHMKIVHGGFSTEELEELAAFRTAIHNAVIDAGRAIVLALRRSGLDVTLAEEQRHLTDVILGAKPDNALSPEVAHAIQALWWTPAVVRLLDDEELNLPTSVLHFCTDIQRIAQPDYTPTEQDVLRAPAQRNTITETRLSMAALSIRLIEVGPQRSSRRKWIQCFESVTSILFCAALSDYDQVLVEDRDQNRMQDSITLFSSIINSRWFLRTSIILFLTEIDVFKAKISRIPLSAYFPEYTGGPDINNAARFILWRFMKENHARLSVYPHLICTNDTESVRLVFAAVKETILQNAIKDSGVLETQVL